MYTEEKVKQTTEKSRKKLFSDFAVEIGKKLPPVEIGKRARDMQHEALGNEALTGAIVLTVGGGVAVLGVAQYRTADVRQMRTDLVGFSRM